MKGDRVCLIYSWTRIGGVILCTQPIQNMGLISGGQDVEEGGKL